MPKPRQASKISLVALDRASRVSATGTFRPPVMMPGVAPSDVTMAMDRDLGGVYQYANQAYAGQGFPGYPYLAELAQKAEYRKIAEIPAKEMTRKWIRLVSKGDDDKTDKIAHLEELMKLYRLRDLFRDAAEQDALYGRAQIYIDVKKPRGGLSASDDLAELVSPLQINPAKIPKGALSGFKLIEPLWTYPYLFNADQPLKPDFYRPQAWYVMGKQVHASRLLGFVSRPVPDILKPAYNFGGMSLSQLAAPYIENWMRTRDSVSDLIHSFSVSGLKTNLAAVLNGGGGEDVFSRIELFNRMRDNRGAFVIDKDTEEFFQFNTPLSGLSDLQAQALEQIAAVSNIPLVKLLGVQPSGLNASSEGEIRVFYDHIHSVQEDLFHAPLTVCLQIIQLSEFGEIDEDIDFQFVPLMQMTEKELSEIRKSNGDRDCAYIDHGVLSPEEVRASLAADPDSGYNGIDVEDVPEPPEPPDTGNLDDEDPDPKED